MSIVGSARRRIHNLFPEIPLAEAAVLFRGLYSRQKHEPDDVSAEPLANEFSDGEIRLNCAKKTAHSAGYLMKKGP
jgi:hypothetical protein